MGDARLAGTRCPVEGCQTRLQRTPGGTLADGANRHIEVVHPDLWKSGYRAGDDRKEGRER